MKGKKGERSIKIHRTFEFLWRGRRRTNERGMEIWEFGINGDQTTERQKRQSNSGFGGVMN
jgi:hypothetical protein